MTETTSTELPISNSPLESFETVLERQNKKAPIEKMSIKSLGQIPDSAVNAPDGFEQLDSQSSEEFLKSMEPDSTISEEPIEKKKKQKAEKTEIKNDFSLDDLDLSKDPEPEPVVDTKGKKSKEDNIAELRKKAEAYEETLKTKDTEVLTYKEKLEKLEAELERTAFERSPKFKTKYETPYNDSVQKASEFAKEIADDASIAEKALSLKGRERLEFIDESFGGGAVASQFLQLINDADSKRNSLETALADYRSTASNLQAEEQAEHSATSETINKNFDRVSQHFANKIEWFRKGDDEDHNKEVERRISAARNIIQGNASQNEMMAAPFLAVIAKEAVDENAKLRAEIAKYKARVAESISVEPRITRGELSDSDRTAGGKPKSAMDVIRAQLRAY
jgi:hypothetical protein